MDLPDHIPGVTKCCETEYIQLATLWLPTLGWRFNFNFKFNINFNINAASTHS